MAKTTAKSRVAAVVNAAREANPVVAQFIPAITDASDISVLKPFTMLGNQYQPVQNVFIDTLINLVVKQIFVEKTMSNKLGVLKKGAMDLIGDPIQHIYINPKNPRAYDKNAFSDMLKAYDNDVKVEYLPMNRQDKFNLTVYRELLANAATSFAVLDDFVSQLVNSVYAGNEIAEWNMFKKAIVQAKSNNFFKVQHIEYPTDENVKKLMTNIRTVATNMTFPSDKYNNYLQVAANAGLNDESPIITQTDYSDQIIIIKSDILQTISVETLATAFHTNYTDFLGQLIEVDDFGYDEYDRTTGKIKGHVNSDIAIMIADREIFQFYDRLITSGGDYNNQVLAWNYVFHVWQNINISSLCNAMVYETSNAPTLVGISVDKTSVALTGSETSAEIKYDFYPDNYTGEVEMTLLEGTKDAVAAETIPVDVAIDQNTKTVTVTKNSGATTGSYEGKYALKVKGTENPNVIISVGLTVA